MLDKMLGTIKEFSLVAPGDVVLVALSGGPDSVALFEGLLRLRKRLSFSVCAAHLNHKLRGAESEEDERFVRRMAQRRGVALIVESRDVRRIRKKRGGSLEEVARKLRYAFLRRAARKCGANKIALGHNLDDNAETFLMNLLRGSGLRGLSGIPISRAEGNVVLIRPLLLITRKEILSFLKRQKLAYREDVSNLDISLTRNRVRRRLLPFLAAEYNPQVQKVLAETARNLRDAEECVEAALAELEKAVGWRSEDFTRVPGRRGSHCRGPVGIGAALDAKRLALHPAPLWREFLRRMAHERLGISLDRRTLDQLCELVSGTRTESVGLGKGLVACREYDELLFIPETALKPPPFKKTLRVPCDIFVPELGIRVEATWLPKPPMPVRELSGRLSRGVGRKPGKRGSPLLLGEIWRRVKQGEEETFEEFFDASAIRGNSILVRTRREGDAFQPLGMRGTRRVKELFIDERAPATLRNRIPIFCAGDEILWIVGHRPAAKFALRNSTRKVLRLLVKVWYCPE